MTSREGGRRSGRSARRRGACRVGTSGFAYATWRGFYPPGTKPRQMLAYYASRLPTVEINATFRRMPSREAIAAWRDAAPPGFAFAIKAPQRITHILRLRAAAAPTRAMLRDAATLADRLGPVLFQCPPNLVHDRARLVRFLRVLPGDVRFAFEFRHASWEASRPLVVAAGHAWCVADDDDAAPLDPRRALGEDVGPFVDVRLRRTLYTDADLRAWAAAFRRVVAGGRDVFCYFKHEETGTGAAWALRLRALVEGTTPSPPRRNPRRGRSP